MRLSIEITLSMKRRLEVQARLGDDADRLAEPHHQHLLGLRNGEDRAVADDDDDKQHDQGGNACDGDLIACLRSAAAAGPSWARLADAAASTR